jgi:hypothetical protein
VSGPALNNATIYLARRVFEVLVGLPSRRETVRRPESYFGEL